jgi:hypothetical protein
MVMTTKSKLTDAQVANLTAIRNAGGIVERDRFGFHKPGEKARIRGMNAVAVDSLIRLGKLNVTPTGPARDTIAIAPKPDMTPSEATARKWQRERFGGSQ